MRTNQNQLEKKLQDRHTHVNGFVETTASTQCPADGKRRDSKSSPNYMEGYLFKRTSNAFKTWNRRWFYMKDNKLFYR